MAKIQRNETRSRAPHDGALWQRLGQLIKVEAPAWPGDPPLTWERIRALCRDTPAPQVDQTLREMERARALKVRRHWEGDRLIEVYTYR